MKSLLSIVLGLLALLVTSASSHAQSGDYILAEIDPSAGTLTVKRNSKFTSMRVRPAVEVTINGVKATFAELEVGMNVKVATSEPGIAARLTATGLRKNKPVATAPAPPAATPQPPAVMTPPPARPTAESRPASTDDKTEKDVSKLSIEDQQIARHLSFSKVKMAALDTRGLRYIKCSVTVNNTGPNEVVDGITADAMVLFRNKDKQSVVLKLAPAAIKVKKQGDQEVGMSYREPNALIEKAAGDKLAPVADAVLVVRYKGARIAEIREESPKGNFENWWKDEKLVFKQ